MIEAHLLIAGLPIAAADLTADLTAAAAAAAELTGAVQLGQIPVSRVVRRDADIRVLD